MQIGISQRFCCQILPYCYTGSFQTNFDELLKSKDEIIKSKDEIIKNKDDIIQNKLQIIELLKTNDCSKNSAEYIEKNQI